MCSQNISRQRVETTLIQCLADLLRVTFTSPPFSWRKVPLFSIPHLEAFFSSYENKLPAALLTVKSGEYLFIRFTISPKFDAAIHQIPSEYLASDLNWWVLAFGILTKFFPLENIYLISNISCSLNSQVEFLIKKKKYIFTTSFNFLYIK